MIFWQVQTFSTINPLGQFLGAVIMFGVLGFLPAYVVTRIQASMNFLRLPEKVEIQGLDFGDNPIYEAAKADIIASYGLHFWPIWSGKVTQWGSSVKYRCSGSVSRLSSYRLHFGFHNNHKDKTEIRCRRQPWWPALDNNSSRPELGFKRIWILQSIDNKIVADLF